MKKINMKQLKEWWQIPKYKSAMKLAIYVFFMVIICIVLAIGSRMEGPVTEEPIVEEKEVPKSFNELETELLNGNYTYNYEITSGEDKTIYDGSCYNGNCLGYKEDKDTTIKYLIEGNNIYQINLGEKKEYLDLYQNLEYNYFNLEYIFNTINELSTIKGISGELYTNYYVLDTSNLTIYYDTKVISKIEINTEDTKYSLVFSKIGEIAEENIKI